MNELQSHTPLCRHDACFYEETPVVFCWSPLVCKAAFKINRPIKRNKNYVNIPSGQTETEVISERCGNVSMQEGLQFPKANHSKKIRK
jgi:hypothetical protein